MTLNTTDGQTYAVNQYVYDRHTRHCDSPLSLDRAPSNDRAEPERYVGALSGHREMARQVSSRLASLPLLLHYFRQQTHIIEYKLNTIIHNHVYTN